jgi:hypothetical protein
MSAPAHVRHPLHASTQGVQYGVDIKDANGMLIACVMGLTSTMLPTARAMAAGPELLDACICLLANAEAGLTNLGAMRAAREAIAKATQDMPAILQEQAA